jgi:hypothetical protein
LQIRLIELKGHIGCFCKSKKSNRTDRITEKSLLRKLDFFIFSGSLPGRLISLLSNAGVVCRPLSFFPLIVCHPILHATIVRRLCRLPLLSSVI